jgi:hypothetical protein
MNDPESRPTGELIKASVEVVKTVYNDAIQPVSQEAGKALGTIGKTINIFLSPLRGLVWGWEKIETYLTCSIEEKLLARKVPIDRLKPPEPEIAIPAIEALRYSKLRELYAALIATSMDSLTTSEAHPAFIEIIKQLTVDEVKILNCLPFSGGLPLMNVSARFLPKSGLPQDGTFSLKTNLSNLRVEAQCAETTSVSECIENLCRSGLAFIPPGVTLRSKDLYEPIRLTEEYHSLLRLRYVGQDEFYELEEQLLSLRISELGIRFKKACISE